MLRLRLVPAGLLLALAGCAAPAPAPAPAPSPAPVETRRPDAPPPDDASDADTIPGDADATPGDTTPARSDDSDVEPYDEVITDGAETREGLFRVHRVDDDLFYEIPRAELGRPMLLVTQVARNTLGEGFGGEPVSNQVVRWELRDDRVLVRGVRYEITADSTLPVYQAVSAANLDPVLASLPVKAWGPDSAAVVDVTHLFTRASPDFGPRRAIRGNLDADRSFVERFAAFPRNVEVEALQTYTVTPPAPPGVPEQFRPTPRTASVVMHWSMVRLPDVPMQPRMHDARVGFFSVEQTDFGGGEHGVGERRWITRWRLEKRDPRARVSEPVEPIVFYVDPATPAEWVPYVKQGIEDWQPAFEAAGFRRAIVAREAPSPAEDPDWSPEDARWSTIRWLPSPVQNAYGPHVHDPRSGEILEADVQIHHNVLELLRNWYWTQAAPLDPRARSLPLPDALMGRLLRYVVAHEVGHSLGFPHNQKASATYPADSVRSVSFLRRMGHTPSIMDYARFNYVAQPEDGIPPELLVPGVGPYDVFAVEWGYRPIPGADGPDEERATLDRWARRQEAEPWLRFSASGTGGADVSDHTEAVGDADPVRSTALGLRNLRRAAAMLVPAAERPGEDYDDLRELYQSLVSQWQRELRHVVIVVGGVESQETAGRGVRYVPMPAARQREAVRFLADAGFHAPDWLLDAQVLRRLEVSGAMQRVGAAQRSLLDYVLDDGRMARLAEWEALAGDGADVYPLAAMLEDVRRGVWTELSGGRVEVDPFRRELQRSHLAVIEQRITPRRSPNGTGSVLVMGGGGGGAGGEARALLRGQLRRLSDEVERALPRAADDATRLHLEDVLVRIEEILDPRD